MSIYILPEVVEPGRRNAGQLQTFAVQQSGVQFCRCPFEAKEDEKDVVNPR